MNKPTAAKEHSIQQHAARTAPLCFCILVSSGFLPAAASRILEGFHKQMVPSARPPAMIPSCVVLCEGRVRWGQGGGFCSGATAQRSPPQDRSGGPCTAPAPSYSLIYRHTRCIRGCCAPGKPVEAFGDRDASCKHRSLLPRSKVERKDLKDCVGAERHVDGPSYGACCEQSLASRGWAKAHRCRPVYLLQRCHFVQLRAVWCTTLSPDGPNTPLVRSVCVRLALEVKRSTRVGCLRSIWIVMLLCVPAQCGSHGRLGLFEDCAWT